MDGSVGTISGYCEGALVVHDDGSVALCTQEIEGVGCSGVGLVHVGGTTTCGEFLGVDGCEQCAVEMWEDSDWRHAAHLGRMVCGRRRCKAHGLSFRRAGFPGGHLRPVKGASSHRPIAEPADL